MPEITASFNTLYEQAITTGNHYFREAIMAVDQAYGEGFARANPAFVAMLLKAYIADLNCSTIAKVQEAALANIAQSLESISGSIEKVADNHSA